MENSKGWIGRTIDRIKNTVDLDVRFKTGDGQITVTTGGTTGGAGIVGRFGDLPNLFTPEVLLIALGGALLVKLLK